MWKLILIVLVLAGCGGGGEPPEFPLFSLWAEIDGCRNLHIQEMEEFNVPYTVEMYMNRYNPVEGQGQCSIDVTMSEWTQVGEEKIGSYSFSNSVPVGDAVVNCNFANETGSYRLYHGQLYMTPSSGEVRTYHYCDWDVETQTSSCVPRLCGVL